MIYPVSRFHMVVETALITLRLSIYSIVVTIEMTFWRICDDKVDFVVRWHPSFRNARSKPRPDAFHSKANCP